MKKSLITLGASTVICLGPIEVVKAQEVDDAGELQNTETIGDTVLQSGLKGRVSELSNGIEIIKKNGRPDAGYFMVRLKDNKSSEATNCPKQAFKEGNGKRWRNLNNRIYDTIFKRRGLWGINANFSVNNNNTQSTSQEIRLVSVKNPHKKSCVPSILGASDTSEPQNFLFIVPINEYQHVYSTNMNVRLKSVHQVEADKDRVNELFGGLGFFAKTISAPLAPIVEKLSGEGKQAVTSALTKVGGESSALLVFEANPEGNKTKSSFIYLGFENFGQTDPARLTGGITLQGDYQASVLLPRKRYFSEIVDQPIPEAVIAATPLRDSSGVDQTVRSRLGEAANSLAIQANPEAFSGACVSIRPNLLALGLSEVDADLWLWAMAKTSSHQAVAEDLDSIDCFSILARANLKRVGNIMIEKKVVVVPPKTLRLAKFDEMHKAMDNLGIMVVQSSVNADLMGRFAEKINVSIADDTLDSALSGGDRDRNAVLEFMTRNFSRYGCYSPRNDTVNYQLRPYMELDDKGRAGAMILHDNDDTPYVVTLGFAGVPEESDEAKALISAIAIQKQGNDKGEVLQDLAAGFSPLCPVLPEQSVVAETVE